MKWNFIKVTRFRWYLEWREKLKDIDILVWKLVCEMTKHLFIINPIKSKSNISQLKSHLNVRILKEVRIGAYILDCTRRCKESVKTTRPAKLPHKIQKEPRKWIAMDYHGPSWGPIIFVHFRLFQQVSLCIPGEINCILFLKGLLK